VVNAAVAVDTLTQLEPDWVVALDHKDIFEGLKMQGRVIGIIARLLYKPEDRQYLEFSAPDAYIDHAWRLSDAIRTRPALMLDLLTPLFEVILNAEGLELEGAIILKLFQEGLASHDTISTNQLRSMVEALRNAINSDFWNWVPGLDGIVLEKQTTKTINFILAELLRSASPLIRAVAWPQNSSCHPIGEWLGPSV
jgi:hypothetical protein